MNKKDFFEINNLLSSWDPIGVGLPSAIDEYSGYIPKIFSAYRNNNIESTILEILNDDLGLDVDQLDESDIKLIEAIKIILK